MAIKTIAELKKFMDDNPVNLNKLSDPQNQRIIIYFKNNVEIIESYSNENYELIRYLLDGEYPIFLTDKNADYFNVILKNKRRAKFEYLMMKILIKIKIYRSK